MTTCANVGPLLALAENGLPPREGRAKKVLIAGAGMAGLTAAYELLRAGHEPLLLEAQNRVGGRVQTLRDPFMDGLHAEAGAMRIPKAHTLTLAYIQKFGISVSPFTMGNPQGYYHLNGRRHRMAEADADPAVLLAEAADHEQERPTRSSGKRRCARSQKSLLPTGTPPGTRLSLSTISIPRGSFWSGAGGRSAPSRYSVCSPTRKP